MNLLDPETPQLKPGIPLNAFYLKELLQRRSACNERFSEAARKFESMHTHSLNHFNTSKWPPLAAFEHGFIQRIPVFFHPLQHLKMTSSCSHLTNRGIPITSILNQLLQVLQLSMRGSHDTEGCPSTPFSILLHLPPSTTLTNQYNLHSLQ